MVLSLSWLKEISGKSAAAPLCDLDSENIYRDDGHIIKYGAERYSGIDGPEFNAMHCAKTQDPFEAGPYHAYWGNPGSWRRGDQFLWFCSNGKRL